MTSRLVRSNREVVIVLLVALLARVSTSLLQVWYGMGTVPSLFGVNTWGDFYANYVGWLGAVHHGLVPYMNIPTYTYSPLFLYTLYPFYLLGGAHAASIPIVASDAATAAVIYLLTAKLSRGRIALIAGLGYALSPFALFYEGYLWMSSQPMTFLMLLAIYLLQRDRPVISAFSLGLAVMVKQEAIFLIPAYGAWYAWRHRDSAPTGTLVFLLTLLVVSIPFLLIAPVNYILSLNYLRTPPLQAPVCVNHIIGGVTVAACQNVTTGLTALASLSGRLATATQLAGFPVEYALDVASRFLGPALFVVALPAVLASRRERNALELFCVYSLAGSLTLYSSLGHPVFNYYYLPAYALLLASALNSKSLLVGVVAPVASLFLLPEGVVQNVLLVIALVAVIAVQGQSVATDSSPIAGALNL